MAVSTAASIKVHYLDGIRFQRVILAAANRLITMQQHLNDINVFPVPDGDTGANMAGTMKSVVNEVKDNLERSFDRTCERMANSALLGARGNSGVIIAQFLCGLSDAVKHMELSNNFGKIYPQNFITAVNEAWDRAVGAIADPKEGTIITVMQDWVDHLKKNQNNYNDFRDLLQDSVDKVRESLARTPQMLSCLKDAGVVDAGAQGFVYILEAMLEFLEKGNLVRGKAMECIRDMKEGSKKILTDAPEQLTFRYCTECLISGEDIDQSGLRSLLEPRGDSLIVAGTGQIVRVHVHTDDPEEVFRIAQDFGKVSGNKVDDMLAQSRAKAGENSPVALFTDSTCDLPDEIMEEYGIQFTPLRLFLDEREYVDRTTISAEEFYQQLPDTKKVTTSQPTPGDFKLAYEHALEEHENILAVHLGQVNSGTYQSAKTVAETLSDQITVVDGSHTSAALGLVVLEAAKLLKQGKSVEEAARKAEEAGHEARYFVLMETLDYAVRGGRVSKVKGFVANLLNVRPILMFNEVGKASPVASPVGPAKGEKKLFEFIADYAKTHTNLRFGIGHADREETALRFERKLRDLYDPETIFTMPVSPVVGIHSGPGAIGIAILGDPIEDNE